jgi:hypothetical protein
MDNSDEETNLNPDLFMALLGYAESTTDFHSPSDADANRGHSQTGSTSDDGRFGTTGTSIGLLSSENTYPKEMTIGQRCTAASAGTDTHNSRETPLTFPYMLRASGHA